MQSFEHRLRLLEGRIVTIGFTGDVDAELTGRLYLVDYDYIEMHINDYMYLVPMGEISSVMVKLSSDE